VPGLDTNVITGPERPLLQRHRSRECVYPGCKLFDHVIAPIRSGAVMERRGNFMYYRSGISCNLKELRSGAIRVGGHEP
jgi:hypothetical protein